MFLHVCAILFTGGSWADHLPRCRPPPGADHPHPPTTRSKPPPGRRPTPREQNPPWSRHPPDADTPPPEQTPPGSRLQSMSGRYASYWNAYLYLLYRLHAQFMVRHIISVKRAHPCFLCFAVVLGITVS